jgi:hypothetical protein
MVAGLLAHPLMASANAVAAMIEYFTIIILYYSGLVNSWYAAYDSA